MGPQTNIYLSSCCGQELLVSVLRQEEDFSGCGVEFGAPAMSPERLEKFVSEADRNNVPLLAHNYFFTSEENFVINLADPDTANRERSLAYVVRMIDYCANHGIPEYSVHSGFACSFSVKHFGQKITELPACDKDTAYSHFISNLDALSSHARKKGVKLLFENNVLCANNMTHGKNLHLLCVSSTDILFVHNALQPGSVSLLLDVGHMKVSSATLGLSFDQEIAALTGITGQVHLHDNDGSADTHYAAQDDSDIWVDLAGFNVPFIIEQPRLKRTEAKRQIAFIRKRRP